ncbi:MAG: 16S rRNA (guanine(966)-N(2))-methyltransferase RsmD [Alphaproteobacteria bacterium]|nr:MAG: 16S rRNA (guanine(966)-N(2))-methyltransferase RsmD [Alphaproteobacteria bacterium]
MRITGGNYKNRKLSTPEGTDVRPTSDRMRQSLFNMLHHAKWSHDFSFENAYVLDLFCGSGALGLEALSHGSAHCTFIDTDTSPIKQNASFIDSEHYAIQKSNATAVRLNDAFDLIFMDPPYRKNLITPALENLRKHNALKDGALIIIESEKEFKSDFDGFETCDHRPQGQSALHILRYNSAV